MIVVLLVFSIHWFILIVMKSVNSTETSILFDVTHTQTIDFRIENSMNIVFCAIINLMQTCIPVACNWTCALG